jgi:predicted SAM-dependent methyltransferase
VVIGAAGVFDPGWIPSDIPYLDITNEGHWSRYFSPGSIDALLAEHVWEHLTAADARSAARNCLRFLKPGGYLRVAVPDGFHPDSGYRERVKPGGTGAGADDHKVLYTHASLTALFEEAGFEVELLEYFDAHGNFHDRPWDPAHGKIVRSRRFDERNTGGRLSYTSVVLDARKA